MPLGYKGAFRGGMELRHLRYFVAVAEALSFSSAAARLHVTQPALSRQIRDLEHELGCALLRRGRNARTELTPEGAAFLEGARRLLADVGQLVARTRDSAASLRFGHYGMLWLDYFTPALRSFAKRRPSTRIEPVELSPRELAAALRRGEVDLAIVGPGDSELRREFHLQLAITFPMVLAMSATHPLAKRRKLRLAELRDASWATWDERIFPGRKQQLLDACQRAGFRPKIDFAADSMASMFVRLATSEAVGHVIPQARKIPHGGVVFADIEPAGSVMQEMNVAWRRSDPRFALLKELADELSSPGSPKARVRR